MEKKIRVKGAVIRTKSGFTVPREVIGANWKDKIEVERRPGQGEVEFWLYVSEEMGDSGGGKMGDILDKIAEDRTGRPYPCAGYDEERRADIYLIDPQTLVLAWKMYIDPGKSQITEAQRRARQRNARQARKARKEQARERRFNRYGT